MQRLTYLLTAILALGASSQTWAEVTWYADAQFAFGGDELADVQVETYDDDVEDRSIDAGEGLSLSIGSRFDLGSSHFDGVLALGYKTGSIWAGSDRVGFDRTFANAIVFYNIRKVQLGFGVTREMSPELDLDDANGGSYDFDDATGQLIQVDYVISDLVTVGLRYTMIEYAFSDLIAPAVDGDNFSLSTGFRF